MISTSVRTTFVFGPSAADPAEVHERDDDDEDERRERRPDVDELPQVVAAEGARERRRRRDPEAMTANATMNVRNGGGTRLWMKSAAPPARGYFVTSSA